MSDGHSGRRRRADGEQSRRRILDAAAEIAGERGYEGTSIATVSARSGLPASSIYWHFQDKDALIVAVIERSFERWLAAMSLPGPEAGSPRERMTAMAVAVAKALLDTPDFLRLGLMLTLERRPTEPTARAKFLQVRQVCHHAGEIAAVVVTRLRSVKQTARRRGVVVLPITIGETVGQQQINDIVRCETAEAIWPRQRLEQGKGPRRGTGRRDNPKGNLSNHGVRRDA